MARASHSLAGMGARVGWYVSGFSARTRESQRSRGDEIRDTDVPDFTVESADPLPKWSSTETSARVVVRGNRVQVEIRKPVSMLALCRVSVVKPPASPRSTRQNSSIPDQRHQDNPTTTRFGIAKGMAFAPAGWSAQRARAAIAAHDLSISRFARWPIVSRHLRTG
jgi:hypothetical protein